GACHPHKPRLERRTAKLIGVRGTLAGALLLSACGPSFERSPSHTASLESVSLIVSEVAQSTAFGGATADKVEVYCTNSSGCAAFKVCDSAPSGSSCSALQPALASGARTVVSRGASITTSDQVWLADATGAELPGTRVGPFSCDAGSSQSRADCSIAAFSACGAPTLGTSAGSCAAGDFPEAFSASVRFTQNQHGGPEPTCNRALCQELLQAIDGAETSIDFAIYGMRAQPAILNALVQAQSRGVTVRGVVDTENSTGASFGYPDTAALISSLGSNNVHPDVGPGYSYIMHNKFFVFDRASVWTGSTNISDTELGGEYNSDVAVLLSSYRIAEIYEAEFAQMFGGAFHNRKTDDTEHVISPSHFSDGTQVRSYFSPTDHAVDNAVIPLVDQAEHTLDIAMFYFTSTPIASAVLSAKARGVAVRMVLDASGASNAYSQHTTLCQNGVAVKVENWGGKSHSKWAIADAGYPGAAVVFGSMNWTRAGDEQNDENTLYVRNTAFANAFHTEFERQWADLASVPMCSSVSVEGADSSQCNASNDCHLSCSSGSCCDGIDNDYDGKIDLQEEACGCADGIDNDSDGYIDAADFDCQPPVDDP
ncbi:MAG TPA: phospholipase D-like domain-containing protein, partial [Polyangiaceae bacterium]|nr:phospholipase D-like domain-containing protein [Polyangiaceae bacterium]